MKKCQYQVTLETMTEIRTTKHTALDYYRPKTWDLLKQACRRKYGPNIQIYSVEPFENALSVYRADKCIADLVRYRIEKI